MIYAVLIVHWIADFILQTDKMAQNKSTSWKWLSSHVCVYTLFLLPFGWKFAAINGLSHFVIDAFTSRATSYLWKKGDRHNFFVMIGADQLFHVMILLASLPLIGW
jgi:hypothetical protein